MTSEEYDDAIDRADLLRQEAKEAEAVDAKKMRIALQNCRMWAARMKRLHPGIAEDWQNIIRFAEEAGIRGSILRGEYTEE